MVDGVLGFGSHEPENTKPTNHFEIHNSFLNNKAQFVSNHISYDCIGSIFTLVPMYDLCNSLFYLQPAAGSI